MHAISDETTTDLVELAKASWNPALLVPASPELFATRPLLVLLQWTEEQSLSADLNAIRQTALEQIENTASLSHLVEPHDGVSAVFFAELGDGSFGSAMAGEDGNLQGGTDLRKAVELAPESEPADPDDEGEPTRPQFLWTIIVLPESSVQHIDLESIEEAIPDFSGRAFWFDPSDEQVKQQAWVDGELDTGYLWAEREEEDTETYTSDPAPGRALFATLFSNAG